MADDKPTNEPTTPTDEQKADIQAQENAKWEPDFKEEELTVPYKAEEKPEGPEEVKEESEEETPEIVSNAAPEPVVTVEDPGEYVPADYSFEVTIKDGKKVKITSEEQAREVAADSENFENAAQLMDLLNKTASMTSKLEKDKDKWEERKAKFDEQSKTYQEREATVNSIASELEYLVDNGDLPKVPDEFKNADWTDPEVAKQPGVKEQIQLINYMVKENDRRAKHGIRPLSSAVDALDHMNKQKSKAQEEAARKAEGEARKAAGARVSAVSPNAAQPYIPKGIAVGDPNKVRSGVAQWD